MRQESQSISEGCEGKYLTFALSQERYGLKILSVQEIIGIPHITHVPKCPDFLKGVINLRGKIIPLIDLRLRFEMEPAVYDEKTCIAVANTRRDDQNILVGVIVDTVLEVIDFAFDEIRPAPSYGCCVDSSFIIGIGRKPEGDVNILLDIDKVLGTINIGTTIQELT